MPGRVLSHIPSNESLGMVNTTCQENNGGHSTSDMSAPPGFPIPTFLNERHPIHVGFVQINHQEVDPVHVAMETEKVQMTEYLGQEGA